MGSKEQWKMRNIARTWVIFVAVMVAGVGCPNNDKAVREELGKTKAILEACRGNVKLCKESKLEVQRLTRHLKTVKSNSAGRLADLQKCNASLKSMKETKTTYAALERRQVVLKAQIARLTGNYSDTELGKKGQKWVDNLVPESMSLSGKDLTSFVQAVGSVTYADSETVQQLWVIHKLREEAVKKVLGADKQEVFSVQNLKVGRHATLGYWRTLCTEERVTGEKTSPLWAAFIENFRVIEEPLKVKPLNSFRRYVCKCKKPDEEEVVTCQLEKIPLPGVAGTH